MKRILRIIWSIVEIFIILYVIVVTAYVLCKDKYGYTRLGNYTFDTIDEVDEKNIDGAKKGDLLVIRNTDDIYMNSTIYYYISYNESYVIRTDQVIDIQREKHYDLYTVQRNGENVMISSHRVIGTKPFYIKGFGNFIDFIETSNGFLLLVLFPVLIVFLYQLFEFLLSLREKPKDEKELLALKRKKHGEKEESIEEKIANMKQESVGEKPIAVLSDETEEFPTFLQNMVVKEKEEKVKKEKEKKQDDVEVL